MRPLTSAIYVDVRCLQDELYRSRGVGYHVAALLKTRVNSNANRFRVVGLVDQNLPELPREFRHQFDAASPCLNYSFPASGSIFISASPMTYEPGFNLRFASHRNLLTAAVVYDFIPL